MRGDDWENRDPDEWDATLYRPELSLRIWQFLEATRDAWTGQWAFLPSLILSEPAWLMHDLAAIARMSRTAREIVKASGPIAGVRREDLANQLGSDN